MMTPSGFEQALKAHLHRQPFKPFVIEFDNGEQWIVELREAMHYYTGDSALLFRPDGSLNFVDCENVRQLLELTTTPSA